MQCNLDMWEGFFQQSFGFLNQVCVIQQQQTHSCQFCQKKQCKQVGYKQVTRHGLPQPYHPCTFTNDILIFFVSHTLLAKHDSLQAKKFIFESCYAVIKQELSLPQFKAAFPATSDETSFRFSTLFLDALWALEAIVDDQQIALLAELAKYLIVCVKPKIFIFQDGTIIKFE